MEQEKQPLGFLFDSVGYNKPEDVDKLIDEMTSYLEVHESPEARDVLRILKA